MAADFINTIQDIRGTTLDINTVGVPANADSDVTRASGGIWQRLKDKEAKIDATYTDQTGIETHVENMESNVTTMNDNVNTKSAAVDTKHTDLVIKYTDFAGADGNSGKYQTFADAYATLDIVKVALVADNEDNINTVADDIVDVNTVATNISDVNDIVTNMADINTVADAGNLADIVRVADDLGSLDVNGIADITVVADDLVLGGAASSILLTSASITDVNDVATNMADINQVAADTTKIDLIATDLVDGSSKLVEIYNQLQSDQKLDMIYDEMQADQMIDYLFDDLGKIAISSDYPNFDSVTDSYIKTSLNASSDALANVSQAELWKWETEAIKRTADSYATEPEDVLVKLWTSNGDGSFDMANVVPDQYSSYHWREKASAAAGDVDTSVMVFTNKTIDSITNYVAANTGVMNVIANGAAINTGEVIGINGFDAGGTDVYAGIVSGNRAVGIATSGTANGNNGLIITSGLATGLDTSGMSGIVYSDGAGGFTTTKPTDKYQTLGFIAKQHATTGAIYVEVSDWSFEQEINYINKNTVYTASDKDYIFCDTQTNGAFTITLPNSPSLGSSVVLMDTKGTFDTAEITVARNGSTIMGLAEDLVLDVENTTARLVYTGSDWRIS